jgi:hypothetical protein
MRTPKTLATAVAALLALAACAPSAQPEGPSGRQVATVRVTNHNWSDMNVFVIRNGTRMRLGTVTSMNTSTFRIPGTLMRSVSSLRIVADPIGSSSAYTSPELQVAPGQQVAMTVQGVLHTSSVSVWERP